MMKTPSISPRAKVLLKHLVELYLRDGQPVGSKTLASEVFSSLSAATVRKVLGDLEDQGYLCSPHTSSGRVPTTQGIRFLIDSLLTVHPLDPHQAKRMEAQFDPEEESTDHLITKTSNVLSELTHMVGIVTLPTPSQQVL